MLAKPETYKKPVLPEQSDTERRSGNRTDNWDTMWQQVFTVETAPIKRPTETAGLKWPPEMYDSVSWSGRSNRMLNTGKANANAKFRVGCQTLPQPPNTSQKVPKILQNIFICFPRKGWVLPSMNHNNIVSNRKRIYLFFLVFDKRPSENGDEWIEGYGRSNFVY